MTEATATRNPPPIVEVSASDFPVCCPPRGVDPASLHPRVYLPLKQDGGQIACPYCSTEYRLKS
jgi:uncharacterized Zn-finger protein